MKPILLNDQLTRVPYDINYFKKKYNKVMRGIPPNIDTNSLYIEDHYIGPNRQRFQRTDNLRNIYRFYNTGAVNLFIIDDKEDYDKINLNPTFTGYRGISYFFNEKWRVEMVAPITELRHLGTYKYDIVKSNIDTIKLKRVKDNFIYVYVRKSLSEINRSYNARW